MDQVSPASQTPARRHPLSPWQLLGTMPGIGPLHVQLLRTAVFCVMIAVPFTLVSFIIGAHTLAQWLDLRGWLVAYGQNLVVAFVIGYATHALYALGRWIVGPSRLATFGPWQRMVFFAGIPLLGVAIGWPIGVTLLFGDLRVLKGMHAADVLVIATLALMATTIMSTIISLRIKRVRAELRANEAQLRLLQGQMEPHFLFNTLANVISLIDFDAPRAKSVLEAFTDYLRASLGSLRRTDSSLGVELELATRFLQLMQTRMGERLRFEFDVDPALRQAAMPPLLLQPLIENAVKHGLEPQVDGGTVRVEARRVTLNGVDSLQLCIDDDGAGLAASASRKRRTVAGGPDGNGVALANLRERLQALYGADGHLTIEDRPGAPAISGTRSCLVLPWSTAPAAAPRA